MGKFIRQCAEQVSYIASEQTWIDGKAIEQLNTSATLTGMVKVVGMPDLHPGGEHPIGAAFFSVGLFYPALIGSDIGCGMSLWQTDIPIKGLSLDKLERRLHELDRPLKRSESRQLLDEDEPFSLYGCAPGTIGSGNHFAELQQVDTVFDVEFASALGLTKRCLQLVVHSGSRGIGNTILKKHEARFNHEGLVEDTPEAMAYLKCHDGALAYAVQNRKLIARRLLQCLRADGQCLVDMNHNLLTRACVDKRWGWLHRKGAAPADGNFVVIPGSRGDYTYVVQPIETPDSLFSVAHGAGRKWKRADCKGRLDNRYTVSQLTRTAFGSRVICGDRQLIYEEAPQAYKSVETVIEAMVGAQLVKPVVRFKPVLTYKTQKESR